MYSYSNTCIEMNATILHVALNDSLETMHMQKCADTKPNRRDAAPTFQDKNKATVYSEITLLRFLNAPQPPRQTPFNISSFLLRPRRNPELTFC